MLMAVPAADLARVRVVGVGLLHPLDDLALVGLVGEELQRRLRRQLVADEGLVRGDDLAHAGLDGGQVVLGEGRRRPAGRSRSRSRRRWPGRSRTWPPGSSWVTAWAMTCAVEWRRTWRPSSVSAVMIDTWAPSWSGRPRSHSSPSTRAATAALARREPIDAATSPPVVPSGYARSLPSGRVMRMSLMARANLPGGPVAAGPDSPQPADTSSGSRLATASSTWAIQAVSVGIASAFLVA